MENRGEDYREAFDLFDASQSGVLDVDEVTMVRDLSATLRVSLCLRSAASARRARTLAHAEGASRSHVLSNS